MTGSQEDHTLATHDLREDEDEGDGGQHQRLHAFAHVSQRLRDDHRNQEIENGRCYPGAESVENLIEQNIFPFPNLLNRCFIKTLQRYKKSRCRLKAKMWR